MTTLLQINSSANMGSTGKIAEAIGIKAISHGWKSYIAYGRRRGASRSYLIKIGGKYSKYFHYIEQRIRDNEGLCSRSATKKLICQIEQIKPDVVHLHNIHDHYLNYRLLFEYLNQTNIKVVWTFHDCWAFTGHCMHFVTKDCERWLTKCHDCPMKHEYPKTLLDRSSQNYELKKRLFGGSENLTIVPCSDWMAGFVRQSFLKDKHIKVIKNGIDLSVFKPLTGTEYGEYYNILAVSSVWNKEKGLYDIIKLRELLGEKYRITIVGLSAKQMKMLPSGINGIQRTQDVHELARLYADANVLINPTYADTFPTVNLEALACGTPVITYRTGGSPEALSSETGVVIEQGDIKGMADAIKKICVSNRTQYKVACRRRAEEYFDKDTCFEKYLELYNTLIGH